MSLNVNRKVEDPFYRYKMPKLEAKVEGSGNGIKTVIPNMVDIARALDRPPTYVTKYFGCELGAQVQMDDKTERYIVNGSRTQEDLQNHLDGFIEKFVLCSICENPETKLIVHQKRKEIEQRCGACGATGFLKFNHRLIQYIINHPPEGVGKGGKGSKKGAKKNKGRGSDSDSQGSGNVSQKIGTIEAPDVMADDDDDDVDWSVDTSAEAVRAREQAQLSGAVTKLVQAEDQDLPLPERLEIFFKFLKEKASEDKFPAREVLQKAELLDCKEKGIMALTEVLLDREDLVNVLKTHQALLQRFADENPRAQKYLLHSMEIVIEHHPALLKKVPTIFNALYDLDIVEEEGFLNWDEKVSKKYVSKELSQQIHDNAKPFMEWLKTADDEDSDEDEEVEEVDGIAFDSTANGVTVEEKKPEAAAGAAEDDAEEEEEDDLDIDDI
ncbi:uncharacterized protein MONBRDRAFT_32075 [Monosiga brevicollis MX1]|uniref:W2 domain-containing protein n=1 Tax=Monosiga brevicollis TaxID=81824 RepID=A9UX93_MONBE|nr:uncharacterized protein MONBRDRAFT_32075 [Monosiga brevicollis MX1]EDQ90180.1 predicted protein [Monosiga brevicollis MX1]|eukprot:XP_001744947.1 hypothetical protein [Monosiga brevicollis MX1]